MAVVGTTSALQAGKNGSAESSVRLTNEVKRTLRKKKHRLIYRAFLDTLENPEKQTQQKIGEIIKKLQGELSKEQKQKLLVNLGSLKVQVSRLENENEKRIFTFMLENRGEIFINVNERIEPLSEENFLRFLISVFEKIREKNLASKEDLESKKIKEVVDKCVDDVRSAEAKDSFIKLAGCPLGIKLDPKDISGSLVSGLKRRIPFLGGSKEEDKPQLSDEGMVVEFLRESLLPVALFAFTTLSFGTGQITIGIAVVGLLFAELNAVKSLFSKSRKDTLYNPHAKEEKEWDGEISSRIGEILKAQVEEAGRDNQSAEKLSNLDEQVNGSQGSFWKKKEDRRQQGKKISKCPTLSL